MRFLPALTALALACGAAGCSRGDNAADRPPPLVTDKFASNHFLQFFNEQASLAPGAYALMVAPASPGGTSGSYTITAFLDDGTSETFAGAWTGTWDDDPLAGAVPNVRHALTLDRAGGLDVTLNSASAACVYLLDASDNIMARTGDADSADSDCDTGDTAASVALPTSTVNDPSYATAYYATIDPTGARATLAGFQQANGFGTPSDVHVIFRDTKDLGYGRDMYFLDRGGGQYAFYVNNFVVAGVPGASYSILNLDAAIAQDRRYHIGTNAIEFGPVDLDGDTLPDDVNFDGENDEQDYFPRFYNFSPVPPYERRLSVDLDGKGEKAMPGPCIVCHGGRADVLLPDGSFPRSGDTLAHLQPLDVGTFEYSESAPWRRVDLEPALKTINQAVYSTYFWNDPADNAADFSYGVAEWDSTMAREMLESWYGGAGLPGAFSDAYVPSGWTDASTGVAGTSALYSDVVATSCRTCHLLRGILDQSDIDFTTYAKFLGYSSRIEDLVYDRGLMPLATLTFREFHETTALAEQLAGFIPGFSHTAGDGSLLLPGRPVARAGPDRRHPGPVVPVSGAASLFATGFSWTLTSQPVGAAAAISDAQSVRPTLTNAAVAGDYVLALTVTDGTTVSTADSVTVTISGTAPSGVTFADIQTTLVAPICSGCHYPGGGPPVFYTDPAAPSTDPRDNRDPYDTMRSLINFADPEFSRLLLKPTGNHHGGGALVAVPSTEYDVLLNWILEGAPES